MKKTNHFSFIFLFTLIVASNSANAIVSVEKLHLENKQAGFSGSVNFGLSGASGYSERFRVKSAVTGLWNLKNALYYVNMDYAYGKSNGIEDQNKSFLHVRKITSVADNLAWELFSQVEQDKFARLDFRGLAGGGLRFSLSQLFPLSRSVNNITHIGIGGFYSRENLINLTAATDNGSENIARANFYLLERFSFAKNLSLFETLYLQPSLTDLSDFRLLNVIGLKSALTKQFSLKLSLETTHDSKPPQGVVKTDWNYVTTLSYTF